MANSGVDKRRRRFLIAATSVVGAVGTAAVAAGEPTPEMRDDVSGGLGELGGQISMAAAMVSKAVVGIEAETAASADCH